MWRVEACAGKDRASADMSSLSLVVEPSKIIFLI